MSSPSPSLDEGMPVNETKTQLEDYKLPKLPHLYLVSINQLTSAQIDGRRRLATQVTLVGKRELLQSGHHMEQEQEQENPHVKSGNVKRGEKKAHIRTHKSTRKRLRS